jgi:hypothetical protein
MNEEHIQGWQSTYFFDEMQNHKKKLEELEKAVKESQKELTAITWERDHEKAITDALEKAYNEVNVSVVQEETKP